MRTTILAALALIISTAAHAQECPDTPRPADAKCVWALLFRGDSNVGLGGIASKEECERVHKAVRAAGWSYSSVKDAPRYLCEAYWGYAK